METDQLDDCWLWETNVTLKVVQFLLADLLWTTTSVNVVVKLQASVFEVPVSYIA
jgi:hypothetical protein